MARLSKNQKAARTVQPKSSPSARAKAFSSNGGGVRTTASASAALRSLRKR